MYSDDVKQQNYDQNDEVEDEDKRFGSSCDESQEYTKSNWIIFML